MISLTGIGRIRVKAGGVYYGWRLIPVAGLVMTLSTTPMFHAMGLWFVAMERAYGWNRTPALPRLRLYQDRGRHPGPDRGLPRGPSRDPEARADRARGDGDRLADIQPDQRAVDVLRGVPRGGPGPGPRELAAAHDHDEQLVQSSPGDGDGVGQLDQQAGQSRPRACNRLGGQPGLRPPGVEHHRRAGGYNGARPRPAAVEAHTQQAGGVRTAARRRFARRRRAPRVRGSGPGLAERSGPCRLLRWARR